MSGHNRLGPTRATRAERMQLIKQACAVAPRTVNELAAELNCSKSLVHFYLKQLPELHSAPRASDGATRPQAEYSYHEQAAT